MNLYDNKEEKLQCSLCGECSHAGNCTPDNQHFNSVMRQIDEIARYDLTMPALGWATFHAYILAGYNLVAIFRGPNFLSRSIIDNFFGIYNGKKPDEQVSGTVLVIDLILILLLISASLKDPEIRSKYCSDIVIIQCKQLCESIMRDLPVVDKKFARIVRWDRFGVEC